MAPTPHAEMPDLPVPRGNGPGSVLDSFRIETIRVEPERLDALMTQVGELTVTRTRIAQRVAAIDEVLSLYEEEARDSSSNRQAIHELERRLPEGKRLAVLYERTAERLERLGSLLERLKSAASDDEARLGFVSDQLDDGIRSMRLLPLSTIFNLFPRLVRDLARDQGKEVQLLIDGGGTTADKRIIEEMKDPLMHMLRNAVDHGVELPHKREQYGKPRMATIRLTAYQTTMNIVIQVSDDGQGIDIERVRRAALDKGICQEEELALMTPGEIQSLVFAPGFSTRTVISDVSGRGVGLDVVRQNVERLKGSIELESFRGIGSTLRVQLPITLSTTRVLIAAVDGYHYAVPVEFVDTALAVGMDDIVALQGSASINLAGHPVSVVRLAELLELPGLSAHAEPSGPAPCVVLSAVGERLGILVDALVDEQEVVLKPLGAMLKRVRHLSGATILGTGDVCMLLNPPDLIKAVGKRLARSHPQGSALQERRRPLILLVEDSITTRTQEKRIFEGAGYEVVTAVDGLDGLLKLGSRPFDAVIADIEMPNMDGLTMVSKIRADNKHRELPIILVTSQSSNESRKKGIDVGANAYITKSAFDQKLLLETLERLV